MTAKNASPRVPLHQAPSGRPTKSEIEEHPKGSIKSENKSKVSLISKNSQLAASPPGKTQKQQSQKSLQKSDKAPSNKAFVRDSKAPSKVSAERTSKELDESEDNYEDEFDEHEGSPEAEQKIRELAEKYNASDDNDDEDNYEEEGFEVALD